MAIGACLERYIVRALGSVETVFERLIFLASLRDAYSGRYLHEGWQQVASAEDVHQTLLRKHQESFEAALRLSLVELTKQLRFHFQSVGQPERETSLLWVETELFREFVPLGCPLVLRELFVSQVRTALEVLRRLPGWPDLAAPIASLRSQPGQSPLPRWTN